MTYELQVPVAIHPDLGRVAAQALDDGQLREKLLAAGFRRGLQCASCGGAVSFVDAEQRLRHFRHRADAECLWGPESYWHLAIKNAFIDAFERIRSMSNGFEQFEVQAEFARPGDRRWQADVACTVQAGGRVRRLMVEVQQSPQSAQTTRERTLERHGDGWDVLWVHYAPGATRPPQWLADAAPSVAVAPHQSGAVEIVGGWVEHRVVYESDLPDAPLAPPPMDEIAWEDWEDRPGSLVTPLIMWIQGDGLMIDDIEGRGGLAWAELPERSSLKYDHPVVTDTHSVWQWRQEEREREHQQQDIVRDRALETQASRLTRLEGMLDLLLKALRPAFRRSAQYGADCITCRGRIAPGDEVALAQAPAGARRNWWLVCRECWTTSRAVEV